MKFPGQRMLELEQRMLIGTSNPAACGLVCVRCVVQADEVMGFRSV